jgi:hypothetical protein
LDIDGVYPGGELGGKLTAKLGQGVGKGQCHHEVVFIHAGRNGRTPGF